MIVNGDGGENFHPNVGPPPVDHGVALVYCRKCNWEHYPVPGESYESEKKRVRDHAKRQNPDTWTCRTVAEPQLDYQMQCIPVLGKDKGGLPAQIRVATISRCKIPSCPNSCAFKPHKDTATRYKVDITRVMGLPETIYPADHNQYVIADHLCHRGESSVGWRSQCVSPLHVCYSTLAINKGRNGWAGPDHGCCHKLILVSAGALFLDHTLETSQLFPEPLSFTFS